MKKCTAFGGEALTEFWFPKRGVGVVRAPACATPGEAAIIFLHLSSFAMRWTVPVPIPSDLPPSRSPCPSQAAFAPCVGRALAGPGRVRQMRQAAHIDRRKARGCGAFCSAPPPSATPSPRGSMACRAAIKLCVWQCTTRCPPYCVPVAGAGFSAAYR